MKTAACALAFLLASPGWALKGSPASWVELDKAYETILSQIRKGEGLPDLPEAAASAVTLDSGSSEQELQKAKNILERTAERLKKMIEKETDKDKKLELYEALSEVQAALASVNKALSDLAKSGDNAKIDQMVEEALFLQKILGSYLGTKDFAGTVHMRRDAFEIEVGGDAVYDVLRKRFPFLDGAIRGRVRINPGAERVSQFNSVKAEYYGLLLKAANTADDKKRKGIIDGLADWGHEIKVIYPGQDWMKAEPIVTWDQVNKIRDALKR